MEEVRNVIYNVLHTMDKISVEGHENMDKLLGCYQYLQKCAAMLEQLEQEAAASPDESVEE